MATAANRNTGTIALVILAIIVLFGAIYLFGNRDREPDTALGRAAEEFSEGVDDAARELSGRPKSTGEQIGEAVEDVGREIKE
ncbi:MAG: hypothetical protein AB7G06_02455 [Bdellovibrionales bacterium]